MLIQIQGVHLRSKTLSLPLSPASDLMWLGLSDTYSPTTMDSEDIIRIYDKTSSQWRVLCDINEVLKQALKNFRIDFSTICVNSFNDFRVRVKQIITL